MIKRPVSDSVLRKAIELRMSDVFPAMNIANALGGSPTESWQVAREFSLVEMVRDAKERGLPVMEFFDRVEGKKLTECRCYPKLREELEGCDANT